MLLCNRKGVKFYEFVNNDPPRHQSIGELTNNESISIYSVAKGRSKHKYYVALNMDEIKALVSHGEKYFHCVCTNSKKEYLAALEVQKRARHYMEETKSKADDNTLCL